MTETTSLINESEKGKEEETIEVRRFIRMKMIYIYIYTYSPIYVGISYTVA